MIHLKGSTLDYYIVEKHEIDTVWNDVKDLITKTNDDVLNEEDILEYLKTGYYILWIVTKPDSDVIVAAVTVEYAYYPKHKMCRVVTLAGEMMFDSKAMGTKAAFEASNIIADYMSALTFAESQGMTTVQGHDYAK